MNEDYDKKGGEEQIGIVVNSPSQMIITSVTNLKMHSQIKKEFKETRKYIDDKIRYLAKQVGKEFKEVKQQLASHDKRLSNIEDNVAYLKKDVGVLKTDVAGLKSDVADIKVYLKRMDDKIERYGAENRALIEACQKQTESYRAETQAHIKAIYDLIGFKAGKK